MANKKVSFKDYKIDENSPAVEVTMEELNVSRQEAIKIIKELSYKLHHPKRKTRRTLAY